MLHVSCALAQQADSSAPGSGCHVPLRQLTFFFTFSCASNQLVIMLFSLYFIAENVIKLPKIS
jgi:hypothetical protein